ncbi:hypothetical protein C0J52_25477 [Blattella germanica]|nr:hypothetical protein C0J52_25477 [Blattella germanica]
MYEGNFENLAMTMRGDDIHLGKKINDILDELSEEQFDSDFTSDTEDNIEYQSDHNSEISDSELSGKSDDEESDRLVKKKTTVYTSKRLQDSSTRPSFDVNQRIMQAFVNIGQGFSEMQQFAMVMNIAVMNKSTFNDQAAVMKKATAFAANSVLQDVRLKTQSKKDPNTVCSFLADYINKRRTLQNFEEVVMFSDSAGSQNKNITVVRFSSWLAMKMKVKVTHFPFLIQSEDGQEFDYSDEDPTINVQGLEPLDSDSDPGFDTQIEAILNVPIQLRDLFKEILHLLLIFKLKCVAIRRNVKKNQVLWKKKLEEVIPGSDSETLHLGNGSQKKQERLGFDILCVGRLFCQHWGLQNRVQRVFQRFKRDGVPIPVETRGDDRRSKACERKSISVVNFISKFKLSLLIVEQIVSVCILIAV